MSRRSAIDLFSGAGGISLGLGQAGYDVRLASDFNAAASATYRANFPGHRLIEADIRDIPAESILAEARVEPGDLDLLIGGPPCQGFSIIGSRVVHAPRNDHFKDFLRIGAVVRPKVMVIENVPGLLTLGRGTAFEAIQRGYERLGYNVSVAELLAAQYGVPQMRWRLVFIGFTADLGVPQGMGFPRPTHGRRGIGELVPNCTISPARSPGVVSPPPRIPRVETPRHPCARIALQLVKVFQQTTRASPRSRFERSDIRTPAPAGDSDERNYDPASLSGPNGCSILWGIATAAGGSEDQCVDLCCSEGQARIHQRL